MGEVFTYFGYMWDLDQVDLEEARDNCSCKNCAAKCKQHDICEHECYRCKRPIETCLSSMGKKVAFPFGRW